MNLISVYLLVGCSMAALAVVLLTFGTGYDGQKKVLLSSEWILFTIMTVLLWPVALAVVAKELVVGSRSK